jgi:alanyl-tRNA synthetase
LALFRARVKIWSLIWNEDYSHKSTMKASDLRRRYLDFFVKKHSHSEILGASLIPENDPTVLFTTAGMHPLVPYLMGESHPEGTRLVDVQLCIRTGDIEEVGDNTHLTLFEMMGNWSLGDYFKKESIAMSYEFLTASLEDGGLALDPDRLAVTCFEGDDNAGRDEEAAGYWEALGFVRNEDCGEGKKYGTDQKRRIFFYNAKENWWGPAGLTGPCGPDTEIFYYNSEDGKMWESEPADDVTPWVEIWNNVFMEYEKTEEGTYIPLAQKNVDTGLGLDRMAAILQGKSSAYDTDLFERIVAKIEELSNGEGVSDSRQHSIRVISDHLRAATFIIGDERGVTPSNHDQGYVLRRLIRRAIRHGRKLGIEGPFVAQIAQIVVEDYGHHYKSLVSRKELILTALKKEEEQFVKALQNGEQELSKDIERTREGLEWLAGIREGSSKVYALEMALNGVAKTVSDGAALGLFNKSLRPLLGGLRKEHKAAAAEMEVDVPNEIREKAKTLLGESEEAGGLEYDANMNKPGWKLRGDRAFYYFETHGFPLEMTEEIMAEAGIEVDSDAFEKAFQAHQEKSRAGASQKFAGGLADHSDETKKLHTATHLMLEALRQVLGSHVEQKGSNITAERLRFDFNHDSKLTPEQIVEVERIVNEAMAADHKVSFEEVTIQEARDMDATGVFIDKYEGELDGKVKVYTMGDFSKEICGGPHVDHTGQLGSSFKIKKEQSSSSGIRRIRAVLV